VKKGIKQYMRWQNGKGKIAERMKRCCKSAGLLLQIEGAGHVPFHCGRAGGEPSKQQEQCNKENRKPALHALFSLLLKSIKKIRLAGFRNPDTLTYLFSPALPIA